jgi:hypothetical protein
MITFEPRAAFGYVLVLCMAQAGDEMEITESKSGYYYFTKGTDIGTLTLKQYDASNKTLLTFSEYTEWLAVLDVYNKELPTLSSLALEKNQTVELSNNTNLFLVQGQLEITDRMFTGPAQIRVRSNSVIATSVGEGTSYSLKFM